MKKSTIVWVIDGDLSSNLHKQARIKPAEELCKLGWQVVFVTAGVDFADLSERIKVEIIQWPKIYFLGACIYYFTLIKKTITKEINGDILFFQMDSLAILMWLYIFYSMFTKREGMIPVVDYRSLPMSRKGVKNQIRGFAYDIGTFLVKKTKVPITAISNRIVKYLNFDKSQVVGVWRSGVDLNDFVHRSEKRKGNKKLKLIYIGAISKGRNLKPAIDAVNELSKGNLDIELKIVGSGSQKKYLMAYIDENRIESVAICDPVPYIMVPKILAQSDMGLLPFPNTAEIKVSSPIKLFEYLAAGLPIVATEVLAHTVILGNKEYVFWVKGESKAAFKEAILSAYNRLGELDKLGKMAFYDAKNYTWKASAQNLSLAFLRVCNSRGKCRKSV